MPKYSLLFIVALTGVAAAFAEPEKSSFKIDTGFVFARGSYGLATDTDVFLALVNPTYETAAWRVEGSLPYVRLKGPATVVGNTGNASAMHSASGVGDAALGLTRKFAASTDGWSSSLGAKVKFPTADEQKGLGTGKMDTTVQIDVFKAGGTVTPFANIGYQFLGHSEAYPMKSGPLATVGMTTKISSNVIGLAGNWRARMIEGSDHALEAMAFLQHPFNEKSRIQLFVLHGFTDASPNLAAGLMLGFTF
ncbi:MAG: hypothetical protein QM715_18545 [Nibricoccus sp.]